MNINIEASISRNSVLRIDSWGVVEMIMKGYNGRSESWLHACRYINMEYMAVNNIRSTVLGSVSVSETIDYMENAR